MTIRSAFRCCWTIPLLAVLVWVSGGYPAYAQDVPDGVDPSFAAASINPLAAVTADAVVRLETLHFEVDGPDRATRTYRRVVTVLTPEGRDYGSLVVGYDDRLRRLKKLSGRLLDAQGKTIRKLRSGDIEDQSAIASFSLYEDNRLQRAALRHDQYPYTVELAYEVEHDGLISWPTWYPQSDVPVEYAAYELDAPDEMAVRYATQGAAPGRSLEPSVQQVRGRQRYRWEARMLPAYVAEPYGPSGWEQRLAVRTAPDRFAVEGTEGDMQTWEGLGAWYARLSAPRGVGTLPKAARADVERLTAGLTDPREKVRVLYAYMQDKTRYVSVQLGLGGWQPYDAAYVHERSYGDCKALVNYMQALLAAAGMEAYPALIRNGLDVPDVRPDFVSNQFNHVVLYVPLDDGPLWLECTSQTIPFGHLGASNEDRYALVVRPAGSALVRTPRSQPADNAQVRHATIRLGLGGDAVAEVTTRYTGNQQDRMRSVGQASGREQEQWLHRVLDLPSVTVDRFDASGLRVRQPEGTLALHLEVPRYAVRTGRRLFVTPLFMDRWTDVPPAVEARTQPVDAFAYAFADADTLVYTLPPGYEPEALPAPVALTTPFGTYEAACEWLADGRLRYVRRFEIREPRLPAEQYEAFRLFLQQVAQADRAQAVFVQAS